jgi:AcrR family transcriptional regulator
MAIQDVRAQLMDAAERVLLRAGPSALTSRAVTTEAGCAKGVLHRHFDDFDDFLAAFVTDRIHRMAPRAAALRDAAGTGSVTLNLTEALTAVFTSAAVAIVPLVTFRDELRARLRDTWPAGIPILTEAATMTEEYLAAERDRGRLTPAAPVEGLAPTLIGGAHLLYADRTGPTPTPADIHHLVTTVLTPHLT